MQFDITNLVESRPLLVLLGTGLVLMLMDAYRAVKALPYVTALGLIISAVFALPLEGLGGTEYKAYYSNMIYFGGLASLVHVFFCVIGFFSLFFIEDYLKRRQKFGLEVYALLVFGIIGMVMLANANDLLIVFVGLEIMSVCLYIMAGLFPRDLRSNEAGLKYFLLGAFASAFLLYGIALLYGLSGIDSTIGPTTKLSNLALIVDKMAEAPLFYVAFGLVMIGFLFKVAAFPFHSWTPDVYTGTPTPLAGFMATGSKLAAFIAFGIFIQKITPAGNDGNSIVNFIGLLAIISMYFGNIVAIQQRNIKRILAYSSIAHTGYLLLGLSSGKEGFTAVIFYMFLYSLMTLGAFGVVAIVEGENDDANLDRWRGLGFSRPWLGVAMSAFMFSLAGIPPLAGFMGKYLLFGSAVQNKFYVLAVLGILSSVIGAYYYIRVIVVMYFQKPDDKVPLAGLNRALPAIPMAGALILVVLLLVFGMFPSLVQEFVMDWHARAFTALP